MQQQTMTATVSAAMAKVGFMTRTSKKKKHDHSRPTTKIRAYAALQPGGVIRWHEARDIYHENSEAARKDEREGSTHYHLNLQQIFRKYFVRVTGVKGFYVLKTTIVGED